MLRNPARHTASDTARPFYGEDLACPKGKQQIYMVYLLRQAIGRS